MPPRGGKASTRKRPSGKAASAAVTAKQETNGNSKQKRTKVHADQKFVIERWRKADALVEAFNKAFPDVEVQVNVDKPRRGSFECHLIKQDGEKILLWSGIKLGPPRKLKFPEPQDVIKAAKDAL